MNSMGDYGEGGYATGEPLSQGERPARAEGRGLRVANTVVSVLIVIALIVFATLFLTHDDPNASQEEKRSKLSAGERIRDRNIDTKQLGTGQLFPKNDFTVQSRSYNVLGKERTSNCSETVHGDRLAAALETYECSSVVHGTVTDQSGQFAATVGVANLVDAPGAAELAQLMGDPNSNGAFNFAPTPGIEGKDRARKKVIEHKSQGHYILFVTATKLDVDDYNIREPALSLILQDCLSWLDSIVTGHASDG